MNNKIVKLTSQNVKRLTAVEIEPNGNLIVIGGKNGQGKSSVLDSIMYVLGGGETLPLKPVRAGQENAEIVVDLGDMIVKRTFTAAGGTNLVVTNKEGAKYPSPQALLDKLVGKLSFDPLEFARRTGDQADTLRRLVGLDFTAHDAEAKAIYDERTLVNREVKSLAAQLAGVPKHDGVPDNEISTSEILKEQRAASETNSSNASHRATFKSELESIESLKKSSQRIRAEIAKLEATLKEQTEELSKKEKAAESKRGIIATLTDIDLTPFEDRMREADASNQKIRSNKARAALDAQRTAKQTKADELTAKLDALAKKKNDAIASAKFPIPGLSLDADGNVIYDGLPFSQASSASQTRVSLAIGLALNPKLRVILIRDGSLLDEESLALVADMAAKNDAQVWMERVSTGGEVSVVIEDGAVR